MPTPWYWCRHFNPRSRMGSDLCHASLCTIRVFQSTLPHGERPILILGILLIQRISIHAPAWGATVDRMSQREMEDLFQSTLPHGERQLRWRWPHRTELYFNPRSRMGSDGVARGVFRIDMDISIHAPAWGATSGLRTRPVPTQVFQSTLPHGERQIPAHPSPPGLLISIHAPAWGATPRCRCRGIVLGFQSTLPHGERPQIPFFVTGEWHMISIHAPAWGATLGILFNSPTS